jgi:AraC family transcriptional regulator
METGMAEQASGRIGPDDTRLHHAIHYIHAHFAEPLSIGDIARAAGCDSGYFTRFFKAMAGLPPRRYLTEVRFERAKDLVRNSRKSMTQIAAECGFADQSHMTNIFRKRVGMTPTAFRDA